MLLARYEQKNMAVQVLSELSGQSTESIRTKLNEQRMRTVMQELGIDRQAFRTAMQTKVGERIKLAVANGTITPEQEKEILAKTKIFVGFAWRDGTDRQKPIEAARSSLTRLFHLSSCQTNFNKRKNNLLLV